MRKIVAVMIALICAAPLYSLEASREDPNVTALELNTIERLYLGAVHRAGLDPGDLEVYSVGQSHIDAAWLWRVHQTREKCRITFGQAVEHMDKYPDFHYSQSAPQYYAWIMEDDPDLFAKIVEKERAGQWEIVGGQWVEPDNNMPDGESFVRQRLYGQRFYKEHFGHISEISWLLDSFGYQWNLPQILAKSGAKYFWTNKLTWNDSTVFPTHLFHWQAPDGSSVLAYFVQHSPGAPFPFSALGKYRHTRYLLPEGSPPLAFDYSTDYGDIEMTLAGDWLNVIGTFYGHGDGGHGPTPREIAWQRMMADKGYSRFATAALLYAALDPYAGQAPTWNDELYLEYHRGTLTTQADIKRANRKAERLLRDAEVIYSIAARHGHQFPSALLKRMWKLALLNQFHDILPGSSIPEVFDDAKADYTLIDKEVGESIVAGLARVGFMIDRSGGPEGAKPAVVFNTMSWERSGIVELPGGELGHVPAVYDDRGERLPSQIAACSNHEGLCSVFRAEAVPAVGYRVYYVGESNGAGPRDGSPEVREEGRTITLENNLTSVTIDKDTGWFSSVRDVESGEEFLGGPGNRLMAFRDRDREWPAWNIEDEYQDHPREISAPLGIEVTRKGPVLAEVVIERTLGDSKIKQIVRLYAGDPRVHSTTWLDFHESNTLVKLGFDTSIRTDAVAADIPYAAIERPTNPRTPAEKAQWEASCQKWLDLSDGERGLALLNNGKYGYSLSDDGTGLRLSLLKAAQYPNSAAEAYDVSDEGKPGWLKALINKGRMTDQGEHVAWTAILPHKGDWKEARLWRAGYEFNSPLLALEMEPGKGELPPRGGFIEIGDGDVYLGALKPAEDGGGLVLRLIEAVGEGRPARVTVKGMGMISSAEETDLLEWEPKDIGHGEDWFEARMKPHEIKTVKIGFE